MKPFHVFLFLIVVILIGGLGTVYWVDSVQQTVLPVPTINEDLVALEPVEEESQSIDSGSYFIFQTSIVKDFGSNDWANDDTQQYTFYRVKTDETELIPFAILDHGPQFSGSLTSYVFGQNILMHRYQTTAEYDPQTGSPTQGVQQDGLLSLTGEIAVRPDQWGTIRSKNGRYQVVYDSIYQEAEANIVVTDLLTSKIVVEFPSSLLLKETSLQREPEPFLIDDTGTYLYVRDVCGCDGFMPGLIEVNLQTLQIESLDPLVDLQDNWGTVSVNAFSRLLLATDTDREPSAESPIDVLIPPTVIRLLDLQTKEIDVLVTDDTRAFDRPWLDPSGKDRYIIRQTDDEHLLFLLDFSDEQIDQDAFLTKGTVLDWAQDWIVVQDSSDSSVRLFNIETKQSVEIDHAENEQLEYIGSITIEE